MFPASNGRWLQSSQLLLVSSGDGHCWPVAGALKWSLPFGFVLIQDQESEGFNFQIGGCQSSVGGDRIGSDRIRSSRVESNWSRQTKLLCHVNTIHSPSKASLEGGRWLVGWPGSSKAAQFGQATNATSLRTGWPAGRLAKWNVDRPVAIERVMSEHIV